MDTSSVFSDEDYDVISNPGQRSLESSIVADLGLRAEIPPTDAARAVLSTVSLSPADIQSRVRAAIDSSARNGSSYPLDHRTVRVYLDGVFDVLTARHMLQLRQAKLAFPSVHLTVGVFSDESCQQHDAPQPRFPHVERCELLRHCRWVDEVAPDAPWMLTDAFLVTKRIDYVALEEGSSVDPEFDRTRLKGYDHVKKFGRVIPTKKTLGLAPQFIAPPPPPPSAQGTSPKNVPESRPEDANANGQADIDITPAIDRMSLDGQQ